MNQGTVRLISGWILTSSSAFRSSDIFLVRLTKLHSTPGLRGWCSSDHGPFGIDDVERPSAATAYLQRDSRPARCNKVAHAHELTAGKPAQDRPPKRIAREKRMGANMKPKSSPKDEAAAAKITNRIRELGDWRGRTLAQLRQLIHGPTQTLSKSGNGRSRNRREFRCGITTVASAPAKPPKRR